MTQEGSIFSAQGGLTSLVFEWRSMLPSQCDILPSESGIITPVTWAGGNMFSVGCIMILEGEMGTG